MMNNLNSLEAKFCSFLTASWKLTEIQPFTLAYIKLLLLFDDEFSEREIAGIVERNKQVAGQPFQGELIDELRRTCKKELDEHIKTSLEHKRKEMLCRLLFCALLDEEEPDFFYLTEPMFEFAKVMQVSPLTLKLILESEFKGF